MIKIGVLGSTKGTDLQAVISSIDKNELSAEIAVIISNKEKSYILKRGINHNIPSIFISHKSKSREEFDREISAVLDNHGVELILLIGFMRILSAEFCQKWRDRLLNVHPSLLPKYAGGMDLNIHEEVLKNGDRETGCTIHFVTEDVDGGPILIQKKCNVDENETVKSLKTKVQALEGKAFVESIQLIQNSLYDK